MTTQAAIPPEIEKTPDALVGRLFEASLGMLDIMAVYLGDQLGYAGFSMGVMPAQKLAQTRPGAQGALFFDSCAPVSEFGSAWPDGVPVQVHGMDADPWFAEEGGDIDAARALVEGVEHGELFLYPGDQHLFADSSLPSYDKEATKLMTQRVLSFLRDR